MFPVATRTVAAVGATLAVIGILYGALLALAQWDAKRLVACSSISHMGFILLGVFALNMQGLLGATLQMVNHGVIIAALFAIVAAIDWRWGTVDLRQLGGWATGRWYSRRSSRWSLWRRWACQGSTRLPASS